MVSFSTVLTESPRTLAIWGWERPSTRFNGRVGACNLDEMLRALADGFAADATLFEWPCRRTAALMSA